MSKSVRRRIARRQDVCLWHSRGYLHPGLHLDSAWRTGPRRGVEDRIDPSLGAIGHRALLCGCHLRLSLRRPIERRHCLIQFVYGSG